MRSQDRVGSALSHWQAAAVNGPPGQPIHGEKLEEASRDRMDVDSEKSCVLLDRVLPMNLCNQLMSFVGNALHAPRNDKVWLLPDFAANLSMAVQPLAIQLANRVPFESLFSVRALSKSLAPHNITVATQTHPCKRLQEERVAGNGWRWEQEYLKMRRDGLVSEDPVEAATYSGLQLSSRLQHYVDESRPEGGYGCLHARIESDMKNAKFAGNVPPSLSDYFRGMERSGEITQTKTVFVAIGTNISPEEEELLAKPTPWGAKFVRKKACNLTFTECALIDFSICRTAEWLVGYSSSTFSLTLAKMRVVDKRTPRTGWYSACRGGVSYREDGGLYPHLCSDLGDGSQHPPISSIPTSPTSGVNGSRN